MLDYQSFRLTKRTTVPNVGYAVDPAVLHLAMKPHQRAIAAWAIRKGRAAVWLDTGLMKSLIALEWARVLPGRTLIFAPLGVAQQYERDEGPRWGIPVTYALDESDAPAEGITITNYERYERFTIADPAKWPKVILDEADVLANYTGTTKRALIKACKLTPHRLTLTATPAPNETVELCNQADFLGVMPQQEMLSRFFTPKGVEGSATGQYRLKGHAHRDFYRWLSTWAIACKSPADLGYDATGFTLPPLEIVPEIVDSDWVPPDQLFLVELKGVVERAAVRRDTISARVARAVELVEAEPSERWLLWYGLLDEAARLERQITGAVVLRGSDSMKRKGDVLIDFAHGNIRCLITHPKIAGAGMNFQTCARTAFVGIGDSYRTYYQAIRRMWRFGQTRPVRAHVILSDPERAVYENVLRKEREAGDMTRSLVAAMVNFERAELAGEQDVSDPYDPVETVNWPTWLQTYQHREATA